VTGFSTAVQPYAVSLSGDYVVVPLLSVGDRVPHTSDSSKQYQMIGVPDGLGAYKAGAGNSVIYMNHELAGTNISEPVIGEPLHRGALVSKFILSADGEVLSGERGYDVIIDPAGNQLPPARTDNTTPAFNRFCSGTLAWLDTGFDRPVYLCGEENPAPATFDGKGGLACAIFDHVLYTLPHLGHFQHENFPVRPHPTPETVLILMEDDAAYHAQLYMYVGQKDFTPGADPLARNGLIGGRMYVLAATTPGMATEVNFQSGSIEAHWVEIAGVAGMNEAQLDAAAVAAGAFGFAKSEDGAWSKLDKNEFFFNSTGDTLNSTNPPGNHLGRTYRLNLNEGEVTGPCTLTILYNADQVLAAGGDIAINPDNIDVGKDFVMVCEDGTGFGRTAMANKSRDGQIWRYDLKNNYAATPIVSLKTPGRDGKAVTAGVWETSGVLDAEHLFGKNSWLFDVQAHPPTAAPAPNTVEDGQLLLLLPIR
jgi:secreted PhoX family phosphatase